MNARPTVAILPVLGPVCPGDSVQLQAVVDANAKPPIQYIWNPNIHISNPFIPRICPSMVKFFSTGQGTIMSPKLYSMRE